MRLSLLALFLLAGTAVAQQISPSDPIYWCNISRAQVSQERDASLAQIEALKVNVSTLAAQNKTLSDKVKELEDQLRKGAE